VAVDEVVDELFEKAVHVKGEGERVMRAACTGRCCSDEEAGCVECGGSVRSDVVKWHLIPGGSRRSGRRDARRPARCECRLEFSE
jgi:hypothetical protein